MMTGLRRVPVLTWRRVRGGRDASPVRRRLALAALAAASAALVATGMVGVVRYGQTFWLYRGYPAPTVAPAWFPPGWRPSR